MRKSKYILTADDYGACDFIDRGIIKAIKARLINSVACFAVEFDYRESNGQIRTLRERLADLLELRAQGYEFSIGLHLTTTAGRSTWPDHFEHPNSLSLCDTYTHKFYFRPVYDYPFGGIDLSELATEIRQQIAILCEYLNCTPADIDSISNHQGVVYIYNDFFDILSSIAAEHGIPIRSPRTWKRAKLKPAHMIANPLVRKGITYRINEHFFSAVAVGSRLRMADERSLTYPTCLVDEIYGQATGSFLKRLFKQYESKVFSAEFMFHLGDPDIAALYSGDDEPYYMTRPPRGIDGGYMPDRAHELKVLEKFDFSTVEAELTTFRALAPEDAQEPERLIDG